MNDAYIATFHVPAMAEVHVRVPDKGDTGLAIADGLDLLQTASLDRATVLSINASQAASVGLTPCAALVEAPATPADGRFGVVPTVVCKDPRNIARYEIRLLHEQTQLLLLTADALEEAKQRLTVLLSGSVAPWSCGSIVDTRVAEVVTELRHPRGDWEVAWFDGTGAQLGRESWLTKGTVLQRIGALLAENVSHVQVWDLTDRVSGPKLFREIQ